MGRSSGPLVLLLSSSLTTAGGARRLAAAAAAEVAGQRRQLQQQLLLRRGLHGAGNGGRRKRPASLLSGMPQPQQQEQRPPILSAFSVGGRRGQSTSAAAAGGGGGGGGGEEKEKRPGSRDADFHKTGRLVRAERVILVRHGESMGNVDEGTYVVVPDWKVPLTRKGHQDAMLTGQKIKEIVGEKPLYIYCSPYMRTKQTLGRIVECLDGNTIAGVREEPRLTEQAFGNFQNVEDVRLSKEERNKFGRFYFRFPDGESGLDVYSRVTSFLATLYADFADDSIKDPELNVVIVTHGLTLRLLVMRWFGYSIHDFEVSINPPNGGVVVIERQEDEEGNQWFEMTKESCDLIGFEPRHTKGSLWRLLQDVSDLDMELGIEEASSRSLRGSGKGGRWGQRGKSGDGGRGDADDGKEVS